MCYGKDNSAAADAKKKENWIQPEQALSDLLLVRLKVYVPPDELARFIKEEWRRIAPLGHRIHGSTA
jgi:hypothetical protein